VTWLRTGKSDPAALALADRHYSRRRPGSGQVGPPGRKVVLVTACGRALWLSHWPDSDKSPSMDGLDAFRCSIFRNEGAGLSSELIVAAMILTEQAWGAPGPDGWVTWVDTTKVRSTNPGYCFVCAGWDVDHDWSPARGRRGKIRLRCAALTSFEADRQLVLAAAAA
jgi:hypothetical protein